MIISRHSDISYAEATPTTVAYKKIGDLTLYIDVHPPTLKSDGPMPAVVYFHGGGMTVGPRKLVPYLASQSVFPSHLCRHNTDSDRGL